MEIGAYFNVIYMNSIVVETGLYSNVFYHVKDPIQRGNIFIPLESDQDHVSLVYLFVILYGGCSAQFISVICLGENEMSFNSILIIIWYLSSVIMVAANIILSCNNLWKV